MFSQIKNKLKKNTGETIAETLISVLLIAICLVMISHAVVVAGKINRVSRDGIVPFNESGASTQACSIQVTKSSGTSTVSGMTCYETSGGYYYYE